MMVNFTGHTCVNCRQIELYTLPSDSVQRELAPNFVEARLHTDGKVNIERIRELQRELAETVANPFYVLLDPETEERLLDATWMEPGRWMDPEHFARFLETARERARQG